MCLQLRYARVPRILPSADRHQVHLMNPSSVVVIAAAGRIDEASNMCASSAPADRNVQSSEWDMALGRYAPPRTTAIGLALGVCSSGLDTDKFPLGNRPRKIARALGPCFFGASSGPSLRHPITKQWWLQLGEDHGASPVQTLFRGTTLWVLRRVTGLELIFHAAQSPQSPMEQPATPGSHRPWLAVNFVTAPPDSK